MTKVEINRIYYMRLLGSSPLYEKGRVLHRRGLDQLEAEMMAFSREWDRDVDGSPNWLPQCGYYATVESDHAHPDRIGPTLACARACDAAFVFATERGGPFTIAYALANAGHDTRRIQDWLGHRSIQHATRHTQLSATPWEREGGGLENLGVEVATKIKSVRAIAKAQRTTVSEVNQVIDCWAAVTVNPNVRQQALALELARLDKLARSRGRCSVRR